MRGESRIWTLVHFKAFGAFWQPCDSVCHAQTRFWLWLCHPSPGSPSTPVRDQEWRRVELINVTVLGRTDKGFRDSRSVFHALTETLIYYKEKKMGSGRKWGAGFASLRESVILARPRDHYLSSAFAWGSEEVAVTGIPWGGQSGSHEVLPCHSEGESRSHEVMSSPFERTVWVPWGGSPIPDEPHHYGQSPPLEGDMFCMLHHCLVALPVGPLSLRCLPVCQPRIQGHCGRMILEAES